jgi:hypothetical protein
VSSCWVTEVIGTSGSFGTLGFWGRSERTDWALGDKANLREDDRVRSLRNLGIFLKQGKIFEVVTGSRAGDGRNFLDTFCGILRAENGKWYTGTPRVRAKIENN